MKHAIQSTFGLCAALAVMGFVIAPAMPISAQGAGEKTAENTTAEKTPAEKPPAEKTPAERPSPEQTSPEQTSPPQQPAEQKTPSSLDDLLEIEEAQRDQSSADAAKRDVDEALQRTLNEADIANNFKLAVEKMSISAELLDTRFDPGLGTQRVQEDILARLELLIKACGKCSSSSSSSSCSSSSSSASGAPKDAQTKRNPGQQRPGQQDQQRNNNPGAQNSTEADSPPSQQGDINTVMQESRAEWGNLPQRLRDSLYQGRREKYSNLYEQLTSEYYKRLAEENAP